MTLPVYIFGQSGNMGQALSRVSESLDASLCAELSQAAVAIDFTSPQGLMDSLRQSVDMGKPLVSGSTGLEQHHQQALKFASRTIPVLWAANMSLGMNLLYQLAEQASRMIGDQADCEIVEAHHTHKKDAPSGSALELGRCIAGARGHDFERVARLSREGPEVARQPGEIGFSSIRAGDIIGEHTAIFALRGQRLELTHRVTDRKIFAQGAIHAAHWLADQLPGLYNFADTLDSA